MIRLSAISKQYFIVFLAILALQSCKKDATSDKIQDATVEYFIDQKEASAISMDFSSKMHAVAISVRSSDKKLLSTNSKGNSFSVNSGKTVENITPVKGSNGQSAYYIINYKEGGFTIISADKRTMSIMSYSETGKFKTDIVPEGLDQWLFSAKKMVDSVRTTNTKYTGQDTVSRNSMLVTPNKLLPPKDPIDPENCPWTTVEVGPLVQTHWGQAGDGYGNYYNTNCPFLNCSVNTNTNGHAYTGCTTTSVAQIIKFHQFPTSYNYSLMANDYSTSETARLMGNIFDFTVNTDYNCDASSGTMDKTVITLHNFGYPSAHKIDYYQTSNYQTVENELSANRPVIFSGGKKGSWFIFPKYEGGHQWVCDGFRSSQNCTAGYLYLHMNWGWNGTYDGWYAFDSFKNGAGDFNYKSQVIVGIHP